MHALDVDEELLPGERPTIPAPCARESGVRLAVERVAFAGATVDVVTCDLTRDPRSEDYTPPPRPPAAAARSSQNDKPPSTSTVRALK